MVDHRLAAGVVGGEDERQIVVKSVHQAAKMPDAAVDVFSRIEGITHAEVCRRRRHELHQPPGPSVGDGARVELGLDFDDRGDEVRRNTVPGCRVLDMRVRAVGALVT